MFEDASFYDDAAIGAVEIQRWRRPVQWCRASELHKTAQLFGRTEASNVGQGEIGDCWLLAAVAVLADFPGHIQNLFDEKQLSTNGKYTVHLYDIKLGWQDVVVDDRIPCDRQGKPLFAQMTGEDGVLWPLLLEKACAKFTGSYKNLVGGSAVWAWQALTGQKYQALWMQKGDSWTRFEQAHVQDFLKDEESRRKWRSNGMRGTGWVGPMETSTADDMFGTLAAYLQANFPVCCSISEGGEEEKRPDGLLSKHEYSLLQVVSVHGERLCSVRNPWGKGGEWNGPWSDNSPEWKRHREVAADLCHVDSDDGTFWMPWTAFADIFGGSISVCPVTLPCPRNSLMNAPAGDPKRTCPRCHQPYSRKWLLLVDGSWHRIADGDLCFLCLRSTSRSTNPPVQLAGIHEPPKLNLAPPPAPRRLEVCRYGAACYRRNPEHFHDCFHPSLLPRAPKCDNGCGRAAASGFPTCCRQCSDVPSDLQVTIDTSSKLKDSFGGVYKPMPDKRVKNLPVWTKPATSSHLPVFLWSADAWMLSQQESGIGGKSGVICGDSAPYPHLVQEWETASSGGWQALKMTVNIIPRPLKHAGYCDERTAREKLLEQEADAVLKGEEPRPLRAAHKTVSDADSGATHGDTSAGFPIGTRVMYLAASHPKWYDGIVLSRTSGQYTIKLVEDGSEKTVAVAEASRRLKPTSDSG